MRKLIIAAAVVLTGCAAGSHSQNVPRGRSSLSSGGFPTSIGMPPPSEYRPRDAVTKPTAAEEPSAGLAREADDLALPPSHRSCGLFGCISSPYLRAKLGDASTVAEAVGLAGAPDSSTAVGSGKFLTWRRTQRFDGGELSCSETIGAIGNRVVSYRFDGNC